MAEDASVAFWGDFILRTVDGRSYTYLLISSECTLYLLSSLYLPGLARGSIATLFLYLVVGGRKHERRQTRENLKMKQNQADDNKATETRWSSKE